MAHLMGKQDRHDGKTIEKTTVEAEELAADKNRGTDSKKKKDDMEKNHLDLQQPALHPYAVILGAAFDLCVKSSEHFKKRKEVLS